MYPKYRWLLFFFFLIQIILVSCGGGESKDTSQNSNKLVVDKSYWGLWKGIDSSNEIFVSGDSSFDIKDFEIISKNIIKINGIYYLRASLNDAQVNGKVSYISTISTQGTPDVGNIDVILRRIKKNHKTDKSIKIIKKPDVDGSLSFNVPGGSEYELEGKDNRGNVCKIKVYVSGKKTEIGNCTLTEPSLHNFKAKLELNPRYNDAVMFGDFYTYRGYIVIENIGSKAGTGLTVTLTTDSKYVYQFTYDTDAATGFSIEPGFLHRIPINISFKFLDDWEESIKINVSIKDVFGRVWNDYVIAHVYKRPFFIKFNKSRYFNGYIVLPGRKILNIPYSYYRLPFIPSEDIWMFFANPQGNDVRYSIGIDTDPSDLDNYTYDDITSFEDNDTEDQATLLKHGETIRSFLHSSSEEKDIDIYKYTMQEKDLNGILDPIFLKIYEYNIQDPNRTTCGSFASSYYDYIDSMGTTFCVSGNGDGILNPGESAYLQVSIQNIGVSEDYDITVDLQTNDPYISVYRRYYSNGDPVIYTISRLDPKGIKDTHNYSKDTSLYFYDKGQFIIDVSSNTPAPYTAEINVKITDKFGNIWTDTLWIDIK